MMQVHDRDGAPHRVGRVATHHENRPARAPRLARPDARAPSQGHPPTYGTDPRQDVVATARLWLADSMTHQPRKWASVQQMRGACGHDKVAIVDTVGVDEIGIGETPVRRPDVWTTHIDFLYRVGHLHAARLVFRFVVVVTMVVVGAIVFRATSLDARERASAARVAQPGSAGLAIRRERGVGPPFYRQRCSVLARGIIVVFVVVIVAAMVVCVLPRACTAPGADRQQRREKRSANERMENPTHMLGPRRPREKAAPQKTHAKKEKKARTRRGEVEKQR